MECERGMKRRVINREGFEKKGFENRGVLKKWCPNGGVKKRAVLERIMKKGNTKKERMKKKEYEKKTSPFCLKPFRVRACVEISCVTSFSAFVFSKCLQPSFFVSHLLSWPVLMMDQTASNTCSAHFCEKRLQLFWP